MKKRSRRENIYTRRFERNLIIAILGVVAVAIFLFFYGVPLLINFSLFVQNSNRNNESDNPTTESSYIAAPYIDPLPSATNSARITVSGTSLPDHTVKVYLNNKEVREVVVDEKNSFKIRNFQLKEGENEIKTVALTNYGKRSSYSPVVKIEYKNKSPNLEVIYPVDQQIITGKNQVLIDGKTDTGVQVTINDYWAIVDEEGNFTYLLNLQSGDNKIIVRAIDTAGNEKTLEINVTFNH